MNLLSPLLVSMGILQQQVFVPVITDLWLDNQ